MKTALQYAICMLVMGVTLSACGSAAVLGSGTLDTGLSARQVARRHMETQADFKTISGRLKVQYSEGETSQNTTFSLRMKRDQVIWLSAPLGIVKVYISPGRVSFYNKLENEYFDGDFGFLSELLGSDIDFDKLQNLLLGQALTDLRKEKYQMDYTEDQYRLTPRDADVLQQLLYLIEPRNFRLSAQALAQPLRQRALEVRYTSYQKVQGEVIPNEVQIQAFEADQVVRIDIEYKQVELNRELRFPYKIPKGFNVMAKR